MIELTVQIEEKEGEVWCIAKTCERCSATDKERTVLEEDFLPLLDDNEYTMEEDDAQLKLDFDLGDDPLDDEEFDGCLDDLGDDGLAPEDNSFF